MTKKDYIGLVGIINSASQDSNDTMDKKVFIDKLCQWLKQDNPNFKESVFRVACTGNK